MLNSSLVKGLLTQSCKDFHPAGVSVPPGILISLVKPGRDRKAGLVGPG